MGISFDPVDKYILITSPTKDVTALEIYSAAMDWCDELENMQYPVPMRAVGKFDMGGGVYSDVIYQLIHGWKLKFWSTTEHFIVRGTLLPETPAESRHVTPADVEYEVSSKATVVTDPALLEDMTYVKVKTENIPSDLPEVPTHPELIAQHGSGSWEGATPNQTWTHPARTLTSRDIVEVPGEEIADEDTLKKVKESIDRLEVEAPQSIAQVLEKKLKPQ